MGETDVFIVGGGPAGLAAAIAARQSGLEVTVADIAQPPIDKACGEGIMPNGVAALEALGVNIPSQDAARFTGIRLADSTVSVESRFPQHFGLGIRRTILHQLLIDRATETGA
ncbi:MAG TPA: FAD-dependent oxidoreductase, partial [Terriglobales bacterium]